MFVVALAELGTSPSSDEALALAADLGATVYEARLRLAGGLPCVILSTPDRERALEMLGKLRARGHGAVAFDARAVVSSSSMVDVRRYRWKDNALELDSEGGEPHAFERFPFADMSAILRATHRNAHEQKKDVKEVKLRPGAALATGGLILTKTVHKEVRSVVEEREQVLYMFGKARIPWLLRESHARGARLGDVGHPTRALHFAAFVRAVRDRAPEAAYDERLLAVKKLPELALEPGDARGGDRATAGIDLLAHVLALWLSRPRPGRAAR